MFVGVFCLYLVFHEHQNDLIVTVPEIATVLHQAARRSLPSPVTLVSLQIV